MAMNDYAIVVLSGFMDILERWVRSALKYDKLMLQQSILIASGDVRWVIPEFTFGFGRCIHGHEPFSFPRNANIGIMAAGRADVFLMNDDVQFLRENSVADLARIAREHPEVGILSPQFEGRVGNPLQEVNANARPFAPGSVYYTEQRLCFTGVYIRRAIIDAVGLLDERFDGYGRDDDDYCRRVRNAGLKLAVTPEVVMRHGFGEHEHTASFRRLPTWPKIKSGIDPEMTRKYAEKWGDAK